MKPLIISLLMAATAMAGPAQAQNAQPDAPIDDAARAAVVRSLGEELRRTYVFPEVAEQVSQELTRRERANAYDDAGTAQAFASRLTADLHEVGKDRHLGVYYSPDFAPPPRDGKPTAEQLEQAKTMAAQQGYGIRRVLRLSGNIGYLDIVGFGQPEAVAAAYEAAAQLLAGSDAVIVDLRSNGGGDPESVAQLMSHFFAEGDVRHINSIYNRPTDTTREYWTDRTVETRYTGPVFVLTSSDTFSGGEEFAYDMQTQKRGTLIGETTGGGANPGETVKLAGGFAAFIPDGKAVNPVTGTNWEQVGVKPDRDVPAADALAAGYVAALEAARDNEANPDRKGAYEGVIARAKAGEIELPGWAPRRRR